MSQKLQLDLLNQQIKSKIFQKFGKTALNPVFGAGCLDQPNVLVFMNPTYRNSSAQDSWKGIRAPWIGVNYAWKFFERIGAINLNTLELILKTKNWTPTFATKVYTEVAENSFYITNNSKHTQSHSDVPIDGSYDITFPFLLQELKELNPKNIFALGGLNFNQLTGEKKFGEYCKEILKTKKTLAFDSKDKKIRSIVPAYYPLGQGQFNQPKTVKIILTTINGEKKEI